MQPKILRGLKIAGSAIGTVLLVALALGVSKDAGRSIAHAIMGADDVPTPSAHSAPVVAGSISSAELTEDQINPFVDTLNSTPTEGPPSQAISS